MFLQTVPETPSPDRHDVLGTVNKGDNLRRAAMAAAAAAGRNVDDDSPSKVGVGGHTTPPPC